MRAQEAQQRGIVVMRWRAYQAKEENEDGGEMSITLWD